MNASIMNEFGDKRRRGANFISEQALLTITVTRMNHIINQKVKVEYIPLIVIVGSYCIS